MAFHQYMYDHRPSRFIGLSGTPITGKVPDWFSLILLTSYNPHSTSGMGIDGVDYYQFCNKFCNSRLKKIPGGRKIREYYGTKNIPGLKKLLQKKYIKRLCKDVLDLGEIHEKLVTLPSKKLDSGFKEEMEEADLEGVWMTVKSKSASAKAESTASYCNDIFNSERTPIVIFSDHLEPVDIISSFLKSKKRRVGVIDGSVSAEERHKLVKFYQAGRLDFLVCSLEAASVGLTMTKGNNVVFNDMSANPATNAQALKRVHRIGQDKPVFSHYMMRDTKLDKRIVLILKQKMKVLREAG